MPKEFQSKDQNLMTVTALAERLGVSVKTAWRLIADRKISYIQFGKRHRVLISQAQLDAFLNEYEVPAIKGEGGEWAYRCDTDHKLNCSL